MAVWHFIKVGSLVHYRPENLEFWLAALPTGGSGDGTRNWGSPSTHREPTSLTWYEFHDPAEANAED